MWEYKIKCPSCNALLGANSKIAGRRLACPKCHRDFLVPGPPPPIPETGPDLKDDTNAQESTTSNSSCQIRLFSIEGDVVSFRCPKCFERLFFHVVKVDAVGVCSNCNARFIVPGADFLKIAEAKRNERELRERRAAELRAQRPAAELRAQKRRESVGRFINSVKGLFTNSKKVVPAVDAKRRAVAHEREACEEKPLGNLTYSRASEYFDDFCQILIGGVGLCEKESRLPVSFALMKEALMVETLSKWQRGADFEETADEMAAALIRLCMFLPDELVEAALVVSPEGRKKMNEMALSGDRVGLDASRKAKDALCELQDLRTRKTNIEWNQFVKTYREVYKTGN